MSTDPSKNVKHKDAGPEKIHQRKKQWPALSSRALFLLALLGVGAGKEPELQNEWWWSLAQSEGWSMRSRLIM